MEKPLIYTIGCPKCRTLELLFKKKKIEYDTCTDINIMAQKGFKEVPMMEYQGKIYDADEAEDWAREYKGE